MLRSQTIGLWARNVWAGRTGLDYWHLTNAQLYLHTPCFPPNTPSCAKASHETLMQPDQRGLITVGGRVKLRIWLKRSPGVTWTTEHRICFARESQTGNLVLLCRWIWIVITSGRGGPTHFSESWLWESAQASLSTLSAFNPTQSDPTQLLPPSLPKSTTNTEKHYLNIPEIFKKNALLAWMWGWVVSAHMLLFPGFIQLYCILESQWGVLTPIAHMHICKECSDCKELYTKFQEQFERCCPKLAQPKSEMMKSAYCIDLHNKCTVHTYR